MVIADFFDLAVHDFHDFGPDRLYNLALSVYSSDVEQSDQEKASSHSKHGEQRESRGQGQSERSDAPQVS
ncbi:MAG: hypothetical protein AB7P69_10590, partial [Candidatus Binatia bacterium]